MRKRCLRIFRKKTVAKMRATIKPCTDGKQKFTRKDNYMNMAVPVAIPHMAPSRAHQRYLLARTASRKPNASGRYWVHLAVSRGSTWTGVTSSVGWTMVRCDGMFWSDPSGMAIAFICMYMLECFEHFRLDAGFVIPTKTRGKRQKTGMIILGCNDDPGKFGHEY